MVLDRLVQLYLALMIGSVFNIGPLYLAFVAFVLAGRMFANEKIGWSKIELEFIFIILLGMILSYAYIIRYPEAYQDSYNIYLANRKVIIEILFALAVYNYLKFQDLNYIIQILFFAILFNAVVGTIELILNFPNRLSMLFPEPSAAGYFYLFIFFIALNKLKEPPLYNYVSKYFMVLGLAIGSKAQIILLFFVGMLKYFTPLKILAYIVVVSTLIYIFWDDLMKIDAIRYNIRVFELYWQKGLAGLRTDEYGVWGTYVTRISAIEGAIKCIIEHPFGIGFGGFNSWFPTNMADAGFSSEETDEILQGILYASPKSNLFDFFVATGVFGIALYISWFIEFWKIRKKYEYLFQSFVTLTLASAFIELNPMYLYIMILFILKEKEEEEDEELEESKE